jgi:hypothetical protein
MSLYTHRSPLIHPVEAIKDELRMIALNESDPVMDGYVTSKFKKELLEVYWYLEDLLDQCSTYEGEEEWFENREKEKMLKKLGGENEYR